MYLERTNGNLSEDEIIKMMDEETWLDADECLEYGFIDAIETVSQAAACLPEAFFDAYENVPDSVVKVLDKAPEDKNEGLNAEAQAIITKAESVLRQYRQRKENAI